MIAAHKLSRARRKPVPPETPSIVLLPFVNLSGDPAQDHFADGMVEEITMALGRLPWLFVIASASAFTYKRRNVDPRQVAAELRLHYLLQRSDAPYCYVLVLRTWCVISLSAPLERDA